MAERAPTPHLRSDPPAKPAELVSVVIPASKEAGTLSELIRRVRAVLQSCARSIEIIVVVPSPDDPGAEIARAGGARVIVQMRPGYGGALKEGLIAVRGDYVITMDADLSHPPEAIADIMAQREKAGVVIASRYVAGGDSSRMTAKRALLSRILNGVYRRILAVPVLDMSSAFRGYQRRVIDELTLESEKYDVLEEILVQSYSLGWDVIEIPFDYQPRAGGRSHARVMGLVPHFLSTLYRLWVMRNGFASADYDSRAYDSLVVPQRYWQRRRYQIVTEMAGADPNRLDIGCGSSRIIQSAPESVGLDVEQAKLRFLRKTNSRLVRGSCFDLPFADHSFSTIVNSQMIEHVPYAATMFTELNRVLKPGGTMVIGTPDYARAAWRITEWIYSRFLPYAYADDHITHYTRYRLTEELARAGFATIRYEYILGGELVMQCVKREERRADALHTEAQIPREEGVR
ncbi:MAG: glycosyltransferase [Deltaproteobacteria bacterium]|nr:glycosyltransferase [Deltaproteobacteria bacterium]